MTNVFAGLPGLPWITGALPVNKPKTTTVVIITRFHIPHSAVLRIANDTSLAVSDYLLCCDWLGRVRLIITLEVCHLATATLVVIGGDTICCSCDRTS